MALGISDFYAPTQPPDTSLTEEKAHFTPEDGELLREFFEPLHQIAERCKAEGRAVIPDDDELKHWRRYGS